MITKKKKRFIMLSVAAAVLTVFIVWIAWSNTALELNKYTVSSEKLPDAFVGFRIAHVSDLHNEEMGEGNERLLSMLWEAKPDIIAITGDLIDSRNTDVAIALSFAEEAMKIAPCYYVNGNHEARESGYKYLKKGLTELGVTVLEDEKLSLERNGETITVIGVNDPKYYAEYLSGDAQAAMKSRLKELMSGNDGYTLLLSHRPELFEAYAECGVDLILSGHAHGGQFRFPLVGGFIAPDQGLFPQYDGGIYTAGNTNMLVSRGIGNSVILFRFNNRPEVILIELQGSV